MKDYYKIGEISKLYGIGTDSLRYYEEIGILKPKRDANGYRMYSISDIITLNILRELRSIGFSMSDIKSHLADFNLSKTLSLFQEEIKVIDSKVNELNELKKQLSYRISEIEYHLNIEDIPETPEIIELPERKVLKLTQDVFRDDQLDFVIKKLQKKNEDHLYLIGNGHIGATIPLDEIRSGKYGHFTSVFCVVPEEEPDFDEIIPGGEYLCLTKKGSYDKIPQLWSSIFDYINEKNMVAEGDPMEVYIIDNHDTNYEEEYITQLQVKVRRK